jgi:hypothetical protein
MAQTKPQLYTAKTIVNLTIAVDPGIDGHLIELPPGKLTVSARVLGDVPAPVDFALLGYRGIDPAATIQGKLGKRARSFQTRIAGGPYMYSLRNLSSVPMDASFAVISNHRQWVELKMILTPWQNESSSGRPPA